MEFARRRAGIARSRHGRDTVAPPAPDKGLLPPRILVLTGRGAISLSSSGGEGQGEEVVALSQDAIYCYSDPLEYRHEPQRREWWTTSPPAEHPIPALSPGLHLACVWPAPPFCIVEVGTPVARRPPHRSRRAVFPHRALQPNTLSIAYKKVCQFGSVVLTELVACVGFVRLSTPSAISGLAPCHDLLRADPTPRTASAASPCR